MGAGSTRRGEDAGGLAAVTLGQTIIFMADAGCTIDQIVAVTRAYEQAKVDRRIQRGCAKAIAAALFPPQSPILESGIAVVKSDSGAPAETFAGVRAAPIKSAARAGILASGLRPAATRVAARLIEHHNVQTGRCDPSIARMARDLGLTGRSVRRAIDELVGALLVKRHVNRGRGHSNSYDIDLVAMSAMGLAAAPQNRTPESAKPDSGVLQNRGRKQSSSVGGERVRARPPDPRQREFLLPIISGGVAADAGAERRIMDDIEREARRQPSFNVSSLSPAQWADAKAAERHRAGDGIAVIRRLLATGPPLMASGG